MRSGEASPLRIAVVGGGPAGSLFALYALQYAARAGRDLSVTIYEGKDFRRFGQPGCNMCAGIVPVSVLRELDELDIAIPPELILSHISAYALHTSAGSITATQPDPQAEIISVYRGAGPRYGHPADAISFDELLLDQAVSRGARLRRAFVAAIERGAATEVVSEGGRESYDLAVLATGVNGRSPTLRGLDYHPPPLGLMCQTELHLGREQVERRLGSSVHIFLPPDEIATYGILIPKGPFVTVSLLHARSGMQSLRRFLERDEVAAIVGPAARPVCGCLPSISVGPARLIADDGFVAIGDASVTRLYKNGIGSALATAARAAWTAVFQGCTRADFAANYLPLCRAIDLDNHLGKLLFLEVPLLKRYGFMPMAHYRLAEATPGAHGASELQTRILWGMFTGAYSYAELCRMALSPGLVAQMMLALGRSLRVTHRGASAGDAPAPAARAPSPVAECQEPGPPLG